MLFLFHLVGTSGSRINAFGAAYYAAPRVNRENLQVPSDTADGLPARFLSLSAPV
jgi:hypothetical protein